MTILIRFLWRHMDNNLNVSSTLPNFYVLLKVKIITAFLFSKTRQDFPRFYQFWIFPSYTGCYMTPVHNVKTSFDVLTLLFAKRFDVNVVDRSRTEHSSIENAVTVLCCFSVKLLKQRIFKLKCNCRGKSMLDK